MKNKSKLISIIIIIILLAIGLGYYMLIKPVVWLKSPKFGLYYQHTLSINEYYLNKYSAQAPEGEEGFATFGGYWDKKQNSGGIIWGGNYATKKNDNFTSGAFCENENDFGVFQYGISSETCLKGIATRVYRSDDTGIIPETQEDLNMFGDFVLKNR